MNSGFAVGVDAGGFSTVAAFSEDGVYRASATGGPANVTTATPEAAADTIASVVSTLARVEQVRALFVGAAGAGRPEMRTKLEAELLVRFDRALVSVVDDITIAFRAAIPKGDGIVLVAGTGSVAYAEHGERRIRVGGLGHVLGDEGSGFWIGWQAVRLLARVLDSRATADETTDLAARTLAVETRERLVALVYDAPLDVARIAAMAPAVVAFAGKGNRRATKIVQNAAQELGDLVVSAARQADLVERDPHIGLAGGLFRENTLLSYLLQARLQAEFPLALVARAQEPPARAALRFAEAMLPEAEP